MDNQSKTSISVKKEEEEEGKTPKQKTKMVKRIETQAPLPSHYPTGMFLAPAPAEFAPAPKRPPQPTQAALNRLIAAMSESHTQDEFVQLTKQEVRKMTKPGIMAVHQNLETPGRILLFDTPDEVVGYGDKLVTQLIGEMCKHGREECLRTLLTEAPWIPEMVPPRSGEYLAWLTLVCRHGNGRMAELVMSKLPAGPMTPKNLYCMVANCFVNVSGSQVIRVISARYPRELLAVTAEHGVLRLLQDAAWVLNVSAANALDQWLRIDPASFRRVTVLNAFRAMLKPAESIRAKWWILTDDVVRQNDDMCTSDFTMLEWFATKFGITHDEVMADDPQDEKKKAIWKTFRTRSGYEPDLHWFADFFQLTPQETHAFIAYNIADLTDEGDWNLMLWLYQTKLWTLQDVTGVKPDGADNILFQFAKHRMTSELIWTIRMFRVPKAAIRAPCDVLRFAATDAHVGAHASALNVLLEMYDFHVEDFEPMASVMNDAARNLLFDRFGKLFRPMDPKSGKIERVKLSLARASDSSAH
jgi:hypothetical protein